MGGIYQILPIIYIFWKAWKPFPKIILSFFSLFLFAKVFSSFAFICFIFESFSVIIICSSPFCIINYFSFICNHIFPIFHIFLPCFCFLSSYSIFFFFSLLICSLFPLVYLSLYSFFLLLIITFYHLFLNFSNGY